MLKAQTILGVIVSCDPIPISAGGNEGAVHKIISPANYVGYCIKIYHSDKRTIERERKVTYMVRNRPPEVEGPTYRVCWPMELIVDPRNGKFIGFLMQLAFPDSIRLSELTITRLSNKFIGWNKFNRMTFEGSKKRLQICVNLASAVYKIHSTGKYTLVDYKPENVLLSITGKVSIIDVDSFQISENGAVLFHSEVLTPEYKPQESRFLNPASDHIPETWDRFSLAVSFYQILFGIHPHTGTSREGSQYENVSELGDKIQKGLFVHGSKRPYLSIIPPPHLGFTSLSPVIQKLFIRTFEDGHTNPGLRPSAEEWGKTIFEALSKNSAISKPLEQPFQGFQNLAAIQKAPGTHTMAQPALHITAQPKVASPQKPAAVQKKVIQKKEDYMPWKIATFITLTILVWLLIKDQPSDQKTVIDAYKYTTDSALEELTREKNYRTSTGNTLSNSKQTIDTLENMLTKISRKYPFLVTDVSYSSQVNTSDGIRTAKTTAQSFSKDQIQFIVPILEYKSLLNYDTTVTISYDIFDPQNNFIKGNDEASNYTATLKLNLSPPFLKTTYTLLPPSYIADISEAVAGTYKVDIWFNNLIVAHSSFEITDY